MPHSTTRPLFLPLVALLGLLGACTRPDSPPPPVAAPPAAAQAQPAPTPSAAPVADGSCAHPFGLYDGSELTYQLSNAKNKVAGLQVLKVARITAHEAEKKEPAYTEVLLKSSLYDASNRLQRNDEYVYQCRHDSVLTDGRLLLDPELLRSFRDRRFAYEPVHLCWPNQPTPGELPGGRLTVQVSSPSVDIAQVRTEVSERKLSGPASVTTPAGTFQCYKVEARYEYVIQARADMARRSVKRVVDFYSPGVGIVRTEERSANGSLEQVSELIKRTPATR